MLHGVEWLPQSQPITIGDTSIDVKAAHGPDWFPMYIGEHGRLSLCLYLRRSELRALRDRLDAIDTVFPEPGGKEAGDALQG